MNWMSSKKRNLIVNLFDYIVKHVKVVVNLWSAHMDPNVRPEPEEFRPERFLNDAGEVINRDLMIGFSLGIHCSVLLRRICYNKL